MKIIEGNSDLDSLYLTELPAFLAEIDKVEGYFSISYNNLRTLKNCPREIGGSFYASYNSFANLVGGPKKVNGNYSVNSCDNLVSLKGICEVIDGDLRLTSNYNLKDFTYFPKKINGNFEIGHFIGGNILFPKEFDENFFRSICDIGGKIQIHRSF